MNSIIITTILLIAAGLIAGSILFWAFRLGIGPTPSSRKVRSAIRQTLPDKVSGEVIELGCGWGHLIPVLREKYPEKTIQAWERSPLPAICTRMIYGIDVKREDFFAANLEKAGLVVCYLYPGAMQRINKEMIPQLPAGCWILTHTFHLPENEPVKTLKAGDLYQTPVYLYQIN